MYGSDSFQNLDGVQALWHHNVGSVGLGLKRGYGSSSVGYLEGGNVYNLHAKNVYNVAATLEYGD